MSDVITVTKGDVKYAMFVRHDVSTGESGIRFVGDHEDLLQLGVMERPKGYAVQPHQHTPRNITITHVSEALFVVQGSIKATVYDEEWAVLAEQELQAGDFLLFLRGGHSIDVLEDARMIEVKQGPYLGDDGAKVFQG